MTTESAALPSPKAQTEHQKRRLSSRVGLFEGILPIDRSRLNGDLIAGATLAALAIPEVMGYRAQLDACGLTDEIGASNLYGDIPIETLIPAADFGQWKPRRWRMMPR